MPTSQSPHQTATGPVFALQSQTHLKTDILEPKRVNLCHQPLQAEPTGLGLGRGTQRRLLPSSGEERAVAIPAQNTDLWWHLRCYLEPCLSHCLPGGREVSK